jgi:hypothetical protein
MENQKTILWLSLTPDQKLEAGEMLAKFHDNDVEKAVAYMDELALKYKKMGAEINILIPCE